jgi:ATP-dependent Clp protease ATP-binding subunit ClpB
LEETLANLQEESAQLTTRWQIEKEAIDQVSQLREEIDRVRVEIDQAERRLFAGTSG